MPFFHIKKTKIIDIINNIIISSCPIIMEKQKKIESKRQEIISTVGLSHLLDSNYQPTGTLQEVEPFNEVWVFDHLLSDDESINFINQTDKIGYGKTHYGPQYRGNFRLILDDQELADLLWTRIQTLLDPDFTLEFENQTWWPVGLNPRFRYSKYYPGHKFARHVDDCFIRSKKERSMLTVNIYLNQNSAATRMYYYSKKEKEQLVDIIPQVGKVLIFRQAPHADLLHAGLKVTEGNKYLMRTDIMFVPIF